MLRICIYIYVCYLIFIYIIIIFKILVFSEFKVLFLYVYIDFKLIINFFPKTKEKIIFEITIQPFP